MEKFIAVSAVSKKIIKIAKSTSTLKINVIILGQSGVGKKLLANQIIPNGKIFEAIELEKLLSNNIINLEEYNSIIIHNINNVSNKNEFLNKLKGTRIIATGFYEDDDYINQFAVKIEIPPLEDRPEDLETITNYYTNKAKKIYTLTNNNNTLKQSIYKRILLQSLNKDEITNMLRDFFIKELKDGKNYKTLLEIFEIPLLKASKLLFKSQVQISNNLEINRITLRKKLNKYFGN